MRRTTRMLVRLLDVASRSWLKADERSEHLRIGARGEEDAYFRLRELGYVMVARNYRSPRCHGEIDLIGWERDVLCFIEVKTRTSQDVKTAEAVVDRTNGGRSRKWRGSMCERRHPCASGGSIL